MFSSLRMTSDLRHLELAIKYPATIFLIRMLLNGCERHDVKLQRLVIGTWTQGNGNGFELTLAAGGTYCSKYAGPNKELDYFGTWVVNGGFLVATIANISALNWTNSAKVGQIDRCRVIGAYDNQLVLEVNSNKMSFERR